MPAFSQSPEGIRIGKWRQQHQVDIQKEFLAFLAIPNVASDSVNIRENAAWHVEGGVGTRSKVVKFQLRPSPTDK